MSLPIDDWDDLFIAVRIRLRFAAGESSPSASPTNPPPSLEHVKAVVLESVEALDRLHIALGYERNRPGESERETAGAPLRSTTHPTGRDGAWTIAMPIATPWGLAEEAMGRAKPDRSGHAYGDEWAGVRSQPLPSQARCSMATLGSALAGKSSLARSLRAGVWRVVRAVPLGLVALLIFIEEWGWGPLSALVGRLARWPPIAAVESHIRRLPPRVALALFLFPALLLVPVKLAALYLIRDGRVTLGVAIIVTAKLVGTALVGRLFILVETQLMEFAWFASCVAWWRVMRDRVMAALRNSVLWRNGRALRNAWRNWLRRAAAPMH